MKQVLAFVLHRYEQVIILDSKNLPSCQGSRLLQPSPAARTPQTQVNMRFLPIACVTLYTREVQSRDYKVRPRPSSSYTVMNFFVGRLGVERPVRKALHGKFVDVLDMTWLFRLSILPVTHVAAAFFLSPPSRPLIFNSTRLCALGDILQGCTRDFEMFWIPTPCHCHTLTINQKCCLLLCSPNADVI